MKRIFFLGLLFLPLLLFAQKPGWQWGTNSNCGGNDEADVITHDKSGNIYVAGLFSGVMQLDTFTLSSRGGNDVFIAKYANDGSLLWANCGGSSADEDVRAITVDSNGNVYMTGSFGGHVIYPVTYTDTAYFSDSSIVSKANMDIYLISYDPNGNIRWLKDYGSAYNDVGKILTCNYNNQIIFSGEFSLYNGSPPIYDSIQFDSIMLYAINGESFILKMNTHADIQYYQQFKIDISGLSIDSENNVCIIGYIGFGSTTIDNITINSISSGTVNGGFAITMLDTAFHAMWGKVFGGQNSGGSTWGVVSPISIACSSNSGVFILGSFKECSLLIQNGSGLPYELTFHFIIAKLDAYGQLQWIKSMLGSSDFNGGRSLYVDNNKNAFVTGYFKYKGYFEKDTPQSNGGEDVFVTQYDSLGNEQWAVNLGGSSDDEGAAITGTDDGSLYLTGMFQSSSFNYQSHTLTNNGGSDMFLVKLSQTTGINDVSTSSNLVKVFPNPADETVTIQSKENMEGITVYDMVGRIMYQEDLTAQKERTMSTISWSDGLYLLKVCNKNRIPITVKIIVHH